MKPVAHASLLLLTLLLASSASARPGEGEQLARVHCAGCHEYPNPDILPERSWRFLLPYMGFRMGVDDISSLEDPSPDMLRRIRSRQKFVEQIGAAPDKPTVTISQWIAIRDFYLSSAPKSSPAQTEKPKAKMNLDIFESSAHDYQYEEALTSLIHIDERNQKILIGDSRYQWLRTLNKDLKKEAHIRTEGFLWLQARLKGDDLQLLSIGDLMGGFANDRLGKINHAVRKGNTYTNKGITLTGLHRPSAMDFGDFDQNGAEEAVITNFGSSKGSVSIYHTETNGWSFKHEPSTVLSTEPGAVDCKVADFNDDGLMDVAVLFSDARENLSIFLNRGQGKFERKVIFTKHAAWGFVRFHWLDFDSDGDLDVITVNGDNADSDPYNTLKAYHGLRLYLNQGDLSFKESYTYPMHGAYGVVIEDFDLDGDFDMAAVAFNPDFESKNREDFVYLENVGRQNFVAKSIKTERTDRWMTIASGDIDADGDKDLILGGGYLPTGLDVDSRPLMREMEAEGRALLVLENKTR